jgi:hypothetical protein
LDEKLKKFDSPEMAEELKKTREKEREERRYEGLTGRAISNGREGRESINCLGRVFKTKLGSFTQ